MGKDQISRVNKVTGTCYMSQKQDVCLGKVRAHESGEHVIAEHNAITVHQHSDLKVLFGYNVVFRVELVGSIVNELQVIGKGEGFVNSGERFKKLLKTRNVIYMLSVLEIVFLFACHENIDWKTP